MSLSHRIILDFGTSFHKDNFKSGIFNTHPKAIRSWNMTSSETETKDFHLHTSTNIFAGKVCSQMGVSKGKAICLGGQDGHQTAQLLELLTPIEECSKNNVLPTLSH